MSAKFSVSKVSVRAIVLVACVVLAACRVSPTGTLIGPSLGAQPWWLVESAHFTLRTDVGQTEAKEIAIDLERTYGVLADLGFAMESAPELHTDVLVFRQAADYKRVGPKGSDGFFDRSADHGPLGQPTFVTYGGISERARHIFVHELTHRFVHYVCPQAPIWLNEGLADYYETIAVEDGKAVLGRSQFRFKPGDGWDVGRAGIPVGALPSLDELAGMDAQAFYAARTAPDGDEGKEARRKQMANYASAWSVVHVLKNFSDHYRDRLHQWIAGMAAGASAQDAYREAFSGTSADALEGDRSAFLERLVLGEVPVLRTDYQLPSAARVQDRAMTAAERDVLSARLALNGTAAGLAEARRLIDAATQEDPSSIEAHLWSAQLAGVEGRSAERERELTETVAAAPGDEIAADSLFRVLVASPRSAKDSADRIAKANAIMAKWLPVARSGSALNDFAWYMAVTGRAEEAVPLARRSTKVNPSCSACFDTLAVALFRSGEYKAAVAAQEMSVAVLGEGTTHAGRAQRLGLFRAAWAAMVLWKKRPEPGRDPLVLPPQVVSAIWLAQGPHVADCRREAGKLGPKASGSVVVRGQIGRDGKVSAAQLVPPEQWEGLPEKPSLAPMTDQDISRCVAEQLGATRFPESSQSTEIVRVVTFQPSGS